MDLLNYPSVYQNPRRLTPHTAWSEHIPFAFFLSEILHPTTFVELGTHAGDSYLAFCQVAQTNPPTNYTAVDTWQGDEHSGTYGNQIYQELKKYHDENYSRFSRLMPTTFDYAASHYLPGSIDLLHIDGLHTYQAVKHDYETWLPKMSQRGVILFHDTQVRTGDFGVWKLWEEAQGTQKFEFIHGHGLGVLGVGLDIPWEVREFFELTVHQPNKVRRFFEALGSKWGMVRSLLAQGKL